MPKTYLSDFPNLPRLAQLNSLYCGPAVLAMLAGFWGKEIDQEEIVRTTGVGLKIKARGMTIEELGLAIKRLTPELRFWFKRQATISELSRLINFFKVPVGVEWQGIFDYPDEEIDENEDDDPGHFSIVTHINTGNNLIKVADPDRHYAGKDRFFTILQFERRWWDINEVTDLVSRRSFEQDDYHAMFVLTPVEESFPMELGME